MERSLAKATTWVQENSARSGLADLGGIDAKATELKMPVIGKVQGGKSL